MYLYFLVNDNVNEHRVKDAYAWPRGKSESYNFK